MFTNKEVYFCGVFGAIGGLFGKLALSGNTSTLILYSTLLSNINGLSESYCTGFSYIIRFLCFMIMLLFNGLMLSNFLIALEKKGTLMVAIISSSINVILTGVFALVILGENIKRTWFLGAFFMTLGIILIAFSQHVKKEKNLKIVES